ncbi:MAG TPA: HWE histidine kinase domain-containing protein, partial [Candidatus Binatia bacterium]|nr:HWE histidine kinase domain-containing protein [Candidatus Binatia bacterium]
GLSALAKCIEAQPAWSDFPLVVLTGHGDAPGRNAIATQLQNVLGNVTFLERPFHATTFISVARSALRSRRRQYETRDLIERRELLTRELQHRTKNLLAVIQAIASASLQESVGRDAFFDRLHALAKAQDLIIEGAGRGALMTQIVGNALESFGTRAFIDGPAVFLNSNAAQGFALIMHELVTNAAKHGSLSVENGEVSVSWSVDTSEVEPTIVFKWRERGGPPVVTPSRKGFGTVLLERAVATSGEPPRFDYAREGFGYQVRAILAEQR